MRTVLTTAFQAGGRRRSRGPGVRMIAHRVKGTSMTGMKTPKRVKESYLGNRHLIPSVRLKCPVGQLEPRLIFLEQDGMN